MNNYKVTNIIGVETAPITAINEDDARRIYRADHKGPDSRIEKVELIRENVPATKQQERDALEKIKSIVATLGPSSYVGTALDGCLVDAEVNIEDDLGNSMKARWVDAEKRVVQAVKEIAGLKVELKRVKLNERDLRAAIKKAKEGATETITALQLRQLSDDDLEDIRQILDDRVTEADEDAGKAAAEIVKYADDPARKEFQEAVIWHRTCIRDAEYIRNLLGRVVAAQTATRFRNREEDQP